MHQRKLLEKNINIFSTGLCTFAWKKRRKLNILPKSVKYRMTNCKFINIANAMWVINALKQLLCFLRWKHALYITVHIISNHYLKSNRISEHDVLKPQNWHHTSQSSSHSLSRFYLIATYSCTVEGMTMQIYDITILWFLSTTDCCCCIYWIRSPCLYDKLKSAETVGYS